MVEAAHVDEETAGASGLAALAEAAAADGDRPLIEILSEEGETTGNEAIYHISHYASLIIEHISRPVEKS